MYVIYIYKYIKRQSLQLNLSKILLVKYKVQFHSKDIFATIQKLVIINNTTNITGDSFTSNVFRSVTNKKTPWSVT